MNARRAGAVALILLAVLLLSVFGRGGGGSADTSAPTAESPPPALYLSSPCDGPSVEVTVRRCGWWRAPQFPSRMWKLHRGPSDQAPRLSDAMTPAEVADAYRFDPPAGPNAPVSAPWVFTHSYLALPLTVAVLIGLRLLFNPPWLSRASRSL